MKCIICKNNHFVYHFKQSKQKYLRCTKCGLIFLKIKKNISDLGEVYDSRKYFLKYLNNFKIYYKIFNRILRKIEKFKTPEKVLDIGCGIGLLLHLAKKRNWDEYGIEVSEYASKFAQENLRLKVRNSDNLNSYENNFFDVIIMNHVLEHLRNSNIILEQIKNKLKSEGILFISVPNIAGLYPYFEKENWPSLQPDVHLYQFTPKTLKLLLKKFGFKSIHMETINRTFKFRIKLLNLILNYFLNPIINRLKMGEAMEIIFIKE